MPTLAPIIDIARTAAKPSLYEIHDHLAALFDTLDLIEDQEMRAAAEAEIDLYLQAEVRKVDRITEYISHCEGQQSAAAEEIKRLQSRKKSYERNQERLEASVQRVMETWGMSKLEGRHSSLLLRTNPPSVEVIDQSVVPPEYLRTTVTEAVDKTAAKVALKAGEEIPGLVLVTRRSVVRK